MYRKTIEKNVDQRNKNDQDRRSIFHRQLVRKSIEKRFRTHLRAKARSRRPTWRPRWPTWRPRRPTWRPRRAQDRQLGGQDCPSWHPKAVPDASRSVPESAPSAQTAQDRNFIDFSSLFDRSFEDFRSIFVRLSGCVFCSSLLVH